jgi:hypothetical protein
MLTLELLKEWGLESVMLLEKGVETGVGIGAGKRGVEVTTRVIVRLVYDGSYEVV